MYNHMVWRTASVISPFYSLLPGRKLKMFIFFGGKHTFFPETLQELKQVDLGQYVLRVFYTKKPDPTI